MTSPADYDNPWKEILTQYFPEFMAFFFPAAHADIDWRYPPEFLDKELRQAVREAEIGDRRVDQLTKVFRRGGEEAWVLVHVEVQGQVESKFAERMYVYNYRLFDRYHRQVASLAVLIDDVVGWRPQAFGYELWGCEVGIRFPTVKLLDYRQRWQELEQDRNPFAVVVMAHLKSLETRQDEQARYAAKLWLMRQLYRRGYSRQEVLNLFRFIDWVLQLSPDLEKAFMDELHAIEEVERMPYISTAERLMMERGLQQGQAEMVLRVMVRRFGEVSSEVAARVRSLPVSQLPLLLDATLAAASLDEVQAALDALGTGVGNGDLAAA